MQNYPACKEVNALFSRKCLLATFCATQICLYTLNNRTIPHFPYYMVKMPCSLHSRLDKGVLRQIFFLVLHKRKCREIIIIMIIIIIKVGVCDTVISDITPSEDSDQSVCLHSLISVFDRRFLAYQGSKVSSYHFENTPIQIYWKNFTTKNNIFQIKSLIFFIFLIKI